MRLSFEEIKSKECGPLFSICFVQDTPESGLRSPTPAGSDNEGSSSSYSDSEFSFTLANTAKFELYIPAPEDAMREDAYRYHITSRNFFAWMFDKPLVGTTLGKTLIDLLERMLVFRSETADNVKDLLAYAERQGYLEFSHSPDYATAFLQFAEHFQLRDLWIDAFAHCVGMNDSLCLSGEFDGVSQVTKALITRAYLEMDLHLGRITRALSSFLEEELSSAYLGLSSGARAHLDRFRTFLHCFYVAKFGYWPPPEGLIFSKSLLRSMYYEFQQLYEYLVDAESSDSMQNQTRPASGGICVLQNVNAFNQRHRYEPLPHPLPLIPDHESRVWGTQSQKGLRAFKLGTKATKTVEKGMTARAALAAATNSSDPDIMNCSLVQDYMQFEREWAAKQEEKVSVSDARKVRWIVVYCIFQMLASVTRAPKEVRDSEGPSYPLCCLITGTPPWDSANKPTDTPKLQQLTSLLGPLTAPAEMEERSGTPLSIHPDCEKDDYFSHNHRRTDFHNSLKPAPLRISTAVSVPISRNPSFRSMGKSVMDHFSFPSRRNSIMRTPSPLQYKRNSFCEIMVHGYGNGLNAASILPSTSTSSTASPVSSSLNLNDRKPAPLDPRALCSINTNLNHIQEEQAHTPVLDPLMFYQPSDDVSEGDPDSPDRNSMSTSDLDLVSPTSSSLFSYHDDLTDTSSVLGSNRSSGGFGMGRIYSMDHESEYTSSPTLPSPLSRKSSANPMTVHHVPISKFSHAKQIDSGKSIGVFDFGLQEKEEEKEENKPDWAHNGVLDIESALAMLPATIPAQA